jgi:uncharacterized membrane protein
MVRYTHGIGRSVAPWRFLLFAIAFAAASGVLFQWFGVRRGMMGGFDIGAALFLLACVPLFDDAPSEMRLAAHRNDANRGSLLLLSTAVTAVILVSVGSELAQKGKHGPLDLFLIVITLCLCWTFSNLVYALHYAHLFYTRDKAGTDSGGVKFPDTEEPDYWDFAYFSSCLGMTFQTSDVEITSGLMRRTAMFHCLGAFVFNLGVIAFTINILGSS